MTKTRIWSAVFILLGIFLWYFVVASEKAPAGTFGGFPFRLGLDLQGGVELVYEADVSALPAGEVDESMDALRDIIERRVNILGVSEPVVQTETGSTGGRRLLVQLPGVTDIDQAIATIGATPLLIFKTERPESERTPILAAQEKVQAALTAGEEPGGVDLGLARNDPYYVETALSGRYLDRALLEFDQQSFEPVVALQFDSEGTKLFREITEANIGKSVAIYLDGAPISSPVVREAISGGRAQISGGFTPQEAKQLVGRLNSGALPVPISLLSTQSVGATLGDAALQKNIWAGIYGTLLVALFLALWYRVPGVVAVASLAVYVAFMLALFKLIPVTLTAAGIAGFIMSIGMAVDANILIFERTKEELGRGRAVSDALAEGFERAWLSIRDSNISSMITAVVLFWLGTSLVKGFALTFGLGVLVSMFTALTVTRAFLFSLKVSDTKATKILFGQGVNRQQLTTDN
ncbi:MAG: protein translocase subunit SecD [Candidatus Vogelbacteria bacterium CG10_big_fil_rev_8_21_14_0_10_51_16]|uniref:Protein translocase subunit SecD n=1 Tax=Candidatus Vogelbacteria bacterium CG10_big_fil_rev_8_21_14_0_10_51_16 TaxID=1975045 RepID=A0A2H0REM7_9BACT|nr:MAG: protein translocase subunit SecD [Candidatus Vogelbacteria bacterium CG10_big_fil_rev_8_21_14_0_10_51_16]